MKSQDCIKIISYISFCMCGNKRSGDKLYRPKEMPHNAVCMACRPERNIVMQGTRKITATRHEVCTVRANGFAGTADCSYIILYLLAFYRNNSTLLDQIATE
jgi:hypothetical protein